MIKKTQNNLTLLTALFTIALVVSNVVTARLFTTGVELFGTEVILPGAVFCYAITFLITDVVGEIWGKQEANRVVKVGILTQVMATALIVATGFIPTISEEVKMAYDVILGQNAVFVIGSLTAYLVSQTIDVKLFHYLKEKSQSKHKWLRNNGSTMISQLFDTAIFITISFGLGSGWLFDKNMLPTLMMMIVGQYTFKLCLALIDTPFFYLLTYQKKSQKVQQ